MSPTSSGLNPLNPAEAWLPWQPTPAQPFDLKWAGHLYRRAAFGASLGDLRAAVQRGLPATLELLLHGQPGEEEREQFLESLGEHMIHEDQGSTLRSWWIYVFLHTTHPLQEKMTLFWHNHFATSLAKVQREDLMYGQNKLLRKHALGSFRPLLLAMSTDPAMLVWLDSNSNVKEKPNENLCPRADGAIQPGSGQLHRARYSRSRPGVHRLVHERTRVHLRSRAARRRRQDGAGTKGELGRQRHRAASVWNSLPPRGSWFASFTGPL